MKLTWKAGGLRLGKLQKKTKQPEKIVIIRKDKYFLQFRPFLVWRTENWVRRQENRVEKLFANINEKKRRGWNPGEID